MKSPQETLEKNLLTLQKVDNSNLISRYEVSFKQLSGKELNTEIIIKINSFTVYLKKISTMLSNYKQMIKNMMKEQRSLNDQTALLTGTLLPDYEKYCLTEYLN
jgi:sorting nexin-1/2